MVTVVNVVTEFEQLLQGYEVRNTCFRVRPSFQRLLSKPPPPPPPGNKILFWRKNNVCGRGILVLNAHMTRVAEHAYSFCRSVDREEIKNSMHGES